MSVRVILLLVTCVVAAHGHHTKDHKSEIKTTLELFTQLEPDLLQWWFQRTESGLGVELKPILPGLTHLLGTRILGHGCATLDQCILKWLYGGPIFIVTKDQEKPEELKAFYTEKGLNNIFKDDLFRGVSDYLRTSEPKTALLLNSKKMYNFKLANKPINKIVTPLNFKLSLDILTRIGDQVPLLFVTDNEDFKDFKFTYINRFGKFDVFEDSIEPEVK